MSFEVSPVLLVLGGTAALGVVVLGVSRWWRSRKRTKTLSDMAQELARKRVTQAEADARKAKALQNRAARSDLQKIHDDITREVNRGGSLSDHLDGDN